MPYQLFHYKTEVAVVNSIVFGQFNQYEELILLFARHYVDYCAGTAVALLLYKTCIRLKATSIQCLFAT